MELRNPSNGEILNELPIPKNVEDIDSSCSTPYVSAPSSPGRTFPSTAAAASSGYFFSAPASPVHYVLSSAPSGAGTAVSTLPDRLHPSSGSFEFGGTGPAGPMIPADEIFLNGQIRPMRLFSHLQRPQALAPLIDQEDEVGVEEGETRGTRLRSRSIHRRARSMSPLRNRYQRQEEEEEEAAAATEAESKADPDLHPKEEEDPVAPSAKRNSSKRWVFLKDLLYRSKSEGRGRDQKDKEKKAGVGHATAATQIGVSERRRRGGVPAASAPAHDWHYNAKRAQAEEMRRRTFLPYRQGVLGCLGFSSRGYGAVNSFARTLSPVPSSP